MRDCAVVARSCQPGDLRLTAYLVPVKAATSISGLRVFLLQALPEYMLPSDFVWLDSLPLTPNGKLNRKALPLPAATPESQPAAPAESPLEKLTAGIWRDVLGRASVGLDDNFFQIGGHSLLATQVVSRLAAALEIELSVVLLFEAPTVRSLAEALARTQREQPIGMRAIPRRPLSAANEARQTFLDGAPGGEAEELLPMAERANFST
ncbi:MAG: phosphopantetheine-binding protein [Limisphaerales bacterium]